MKAQLILKLAIVGCLTFTSVKAQTVDGVKLSDLKETYLEVSEYRRLLGEKTFIALDFGQKKDINNFREVVVRDEKGKYLEYNSMMDFINKMQQYGYELFQVYSLGTSENTWPRYILKKNLAK
jgi:hypothetical protein